MYDTAYTKNNTPLPVHEHHRPHELSAHRQALEHAEEGQEDGRGLPNLGVGGEAALYVRAYVCVCWGGLG